MLVISGINGVEVDRHGLIFLENDATGPREVFKYLPGLRDYIKKLKNREHIENLKIAEIPYFPVYLYSRYTALAADMLHYNMLFDFVCIYVILYN